MKRLRQLIFLALVTMPCALSAQSFSGRLTSSFYAYERSDSIGATSGHARGYQAFQIDLRNPNLLFRTYGQLDTDFSTELAGDGRVRMYNLYFEWKNIAQRGELRLGRQPIFGGAGSGTVDGAQLKVRVAKWLRLKAYGGGLLPLHQRAKLTDDFGENYMAGGQATFSPNSDLNLSVSYFDKHQQREGFEALRADSVGNIFTQFISPEDRAFRFASVDASWQFNRGSSLYGRSDYDWHGSQITRGELAIRSELSSKIFVSGNYIFRSPRLPWNSIFSVFNIEDNHEIEGGLTYRHRPNLRFYGNVAEILYSDDESLRFTLGADCNHGSLHFVRRSGYAGELNGVNAAFYYPLHAGTCLPSLQVSWASYKLDADADESQDLFSGAAGLLVRPWQEITFDGQLQFLNNRFYSNDVRFLLRVQYWFFNR